MIGSSYLTPTNDSASIDLYINFNAFEIKKFWLS